MISIKASLILRVLKGVSVNKTTNCWEWQGANSGQGNGAGRGYGRMSVYGHTSAVHRVMWSCHHGYLPVGKQIDHTCNNRICCNPYHLQIVTHKQNHKLRMERCACK